MRFDGKDFAMTKNGERKFTFGDQNENEVVFVLGKSGRIEFLFTELYGAKKIDFDRFGQYAEGVG